MRTTLLLITVLLAVTPLAAGDQLTAEERSTLLAHLAESRAELLAEVEGLSQGQLTWQPAGDKWAVLDCVEHLARTEALIRKRVEALLAEEPGAMDRQATDEGVLKFTTDRSQTFNAPDPVRPTRQWPTTAEPLSRLLELRKANMEFAKTTTADLRAHVGPNPALGNMDAYQWMLFMSGHMLRHTEQIREIKANSNFPK